MLGGILPRMEKQTGAENRMPEEKREFALSITTRYVNNNNNNDSWH